MSINKSEIEKSLGVKLTESQIAGVEGLIYEKLKLTKSQLGEMDDFILKEIDKIPSKMPRQLISEHAEANRRMPNGSPRPGPFSLSYTPWLREIMDNLSPTSVIQRTIFMKAAQIGATTAAECVLCYYIGHAPANILFVSANDDILKRWAAMNLEPAIESYNLRENIRAQYTHNKSKRTGDTTMFKEYSGCRLDLASAQSGARLRSTTKKILFRDECDGVKPELNSGEGNWFDVSYARTNAWGERRKVFDLSTPTTYERSLIYPAYLEGDQRKFFVPCPNCDHGQELVFGDEGADYGLKPKIKNKELIDVYYLCIQCRKPIYNYQKMEFFKEGIWTATGKSTSPYIRSYHLSTLYSPLGMTSWKELYEVFTKAKDDPAKIRSFKNLYLGEPYKLDSSRPKLDIVKELKGNYKRGTVPYGVLFLTVAIDVQRGSKKDKKNPPRIELEVLGHGGGWRSWSIQYFRIEGAVGDPFAGAWEKLTDIVTEGGFVFERKEDGMKFSPKLVFIDSGDGANTSTVYHFCETWDNTYAIKGRNFIKKNGIQYEDDAKVDGLTIKRYRLSKLEGGNHIYLISSNYYKGELYRNLTLVRRVVGQNPPGFCDFPNDYKDSYFKMLSAAEKRIDGSFSSGGRRAEALDCRAYNLCARDVYLNMLVSSYKAHYKEKGYNLYELEKINTAFVLQSLKVETGQKEVK